jgi:hypothetical protein
MMPIPPPDGTVLFRDARIMFRNFTGRKQQFNSEGERNFCLMIDDPEQAAQLRKDGWNVKQLKPRDEGDEPQDYIQVKVAYGKGRPPRVALVTSKGRNDLGADEISILDVADIRKIDVIIRPYDWEVDDNRGRKAYLKTLFATLNEDELEAEYAHILDDDRNVEAAIPDDLNVLL